MAIKVIVHHLADVFTAVIAKNSGTTRTDNLITAFFFQNPNLAFSTRSDQCFSSRLFDHSPFRNPSLLLELFTGQWDVCFSFTKPTGNFLAFGVMASKFSILLYRYTYCRKVTERTCAKVLYLCHADLILLLKTFQFLNCLIIEKTRPLISGERGLTSAAVHALQYIPRISDDGICIRFRTVETEEMASFSVAMGHFGRNEVIVTALTLHNFSHSSKPLIFGVFCLLSVSGRLAVCCEKKPC